MIIGCTLNMNGSQKMLKLGNTIDYLIVDEACQSTEVEMLIPLQLCPKRTILVGDQKQLPPTTISVDSEASKFSRSLFERLLDAGIDKQMLIIQYRMHPDIRQFPSDCFYGGQIVDHSSVYERTQPDLIFEKRVVFFDL